MRVWSRSGGLRSRAAVAAASLPILLALAVGAPTAGATSIPQLGKCSQLEKVLPLPDGSAVAAGSTWSSPGCLEPEAGGKRILVRFTPDGSLDSSFGDGGAVVLPGATGRTVGLFKTDVGDFLVVNQFEAARVTAEGKLDPEFADQGRLFPGSFGDASHNIRSAEVAGGHIYLLQTSDGYPAMARFSLDGLRDPTFGEGGLKKWTDKSRPYEVLTADSAGRLVVARSFYLSTGPGVGYTTMEVSRFLSDGSADTGFGSDSTGWVRLSESECYQGGCSMDRIDRIRLDEAGNIFVLGSERHQMVKAPDCYNGVVAVFGKDGEPEAGGARGQMVGDCRVVGLTGLLPGGDLIGVNGDRWSNHYLTDANPIFAPTRWRLQPDPDPGVAFGNAKPFWSGALRLGPFTQGNLDAVSDPDRGQIVAVGYADATGCDPGCQAGRSIVMVRLDAATGKPVAGFGQGGVQMLPVSGCRYGAGLREGLPSPVWKPCRVAPPAGDVTARVLKRKAKHPKLVVQASPGPPSQSMWATTQVLRLNLPKVLGPIRKRAGKLEASVLGATEGGETNIRLVGRSLVVSHRAGHGGCAYYEGCSPPDPTLRFEVELALAPSAGARRDLQRKLRRSTLKLTGRMAFQPNPTSLDIISPSGWFTANHRKFSVRVR